MDLFLEIKNLTEEKKFHILRLKNELAYFEESVDELTKCTNPQQNREETREEEYETEVDSSIASLVCTCAYAQPNEGGSREVCESETSDVDSSMSSA